MGWDKKKFTSKISPLLQSRLSYGKIEVWTQKMCIKKTLDNVDLP